MPKLERDRQMRQDRKSGMSFRKLAKKYRMSLSGVYYVVKGDWRKR